MKGCGELVLFFFFFLIFDFLFFLIFRIELREIESEWLEMTDRTSVILCTSQLILFSFGLAQLSHPLSGSLSSASPALLDSQGVVQISAALQSGVSIDALLCAVWWSLLAGAALTYLVRAYDF